MIKKWFYKFIYKLRMRNLELNYFNSWHLEYDSEFFDESIDCFIFEQTKDNEHV